MRFVPNVPTTGYGMDMIKSGGWLHHPHIRYRFALAIALLLAVILHLAFEAIYSLATLHTDVRALAGSVAHDPACRCNGWFYNEELVYPVTYSFRFHHCAQENLHFVVNKRKQYISSQILIFVANINCISALKEAASKEIYPLYFTSE